MKSEIDIQTINATRQYVFHTKSNLIIFLLLTLCIFVTQYLPGVGTAFTYQGRLNDGGNPANGTYDLRFVLYNAEIGGSQIGSVVERDDIVVSNGLLMVELDFGVEVFDGQALWLEISLRLGSSTGSYTVLSPRQRLSPTPYAIALPGLHTEQNSYCNNIVGGHTGNTTTAGAYGCTISGGGYASKSNIVTDNYGTISGGSFNQAGNDNGLANDAEYASVIGGYANSAVGKSSAVLGGYWNTASGNYSLAAGHRARAVHSGSFVWADSTDSDFSSSTYNEFAVRATGGVKLNVDESGSGLRIEPNSTSPNSINGFYGNQVTSGVYGATISGGGESSADANNRVTDDFGTVSGGKGNTTDGTYATIGGGFGNITNGVGATIGGGSSNMAGHRSTVPGGYDNQANGAFSFAAGTHAKANHRGTFVWADSYSSDFTSTGNFQFLIHAVGGVGIGTNSPSTQLHIQDEISGSASLANHVTAIENTSTDTSPDILALKVNTNDPGTGVNFITFMDSDENIGAIEGNGSGGITVNTTSGDFAEYMPIFDNSSNPSSGDIVGVFPNGISHKTNNAKQVMVVSTSPIILGNRPKSDEESNYVPIALLGQVPVRVKGIINAGDYIIPSGLEDGTGFALSSDQIDLEQCTQIVGQALESSSEQDVKLIKTMVGFPQNGLFNNILAAKSNQIEELQRELVSIKSEIKRLKKNRE